MRLELEDPEVAASLIPGSLGSVAIYTSNVEIAHVIRRVMIRVDALADDLGMAGGDLFDQGSA